MNKILRRHFPTLFSKFDFSYNWLIIKLDKDSDENTDNKTIRKCFIERGGIGIANLPK